jgi:hypothetical protein
MIIHQYVLGLRCGDKQIDVKRCIYLSLKERIPGTLFDTNFNGVTLILRDDSRTTFKMARTVLI